MNPVGDEAPEDTLAWGVYAGRKGAQQAGKGIG